MSEIQRFTVHGELELHRVGEVVLITEHAAAMAAKDAEIKRLRDALEKVAHDGTLCAYCGSTHDEIPGCPVGSALAAPAPEQALDRERDHLTEIWRLNAQIRVLREALECWPLKRLISYARDNGESMMALLFEEVRNAALATAPEGEKQP